jgi:multiple antibiotic resistance protein
MSSLHVATAALAALLPITNPIGAVAAFAALTGGQARDAVAKQAVRTGIYVAAILAVFGLVGTYVLQGLGITIPALQIAGGLVVAHSGFGMIVPRTQFTDAEQDHAATKQDVSFSPMALPLVAGPGAIGVVIALAARNPGLADHLAIAAAAVAIGLITGIALRFGTPVIERLGPTGVGALSRIMGFLILTIGVELVVHGVLAVVASQ